MLPRLAPTIRFVFLLLTSNASLADEPAKELSQPSPLSAVRDLLNVNELVKAAEYVRKAGEAFERFGGSLGGLADALATMSREFDPLGYKTAFRALGRQTEIIKQQSEIIQAFQAREIERLRNENQQLRERLGRIEQRKPRVAEQFWLNLYLVDKSRIPFTLSAQGVDMSSILMSDFMVEYNSERRDEYGPLLSQSFAL